MVSLTQRRRLCGVCAGWPNIFYYKYDRSTLSFDPEALEGRPSKGGSRRVEFLNFRHFSSF
jgi:hypothetical protein